MLPVPERAIWLPVCAPELMDGPFADEIVRYVTPVKHFLRHCQEPYTLRGVTFRNRIVMSPMCQYSARDGFADHRLRQRHQAAAAESLDHSE